VIAAGVGREDGMELSEDTLREIGRLGGLVLGHQDHEGVLTEICTIAVNALPPVEGASVTTYESGRPATVAASDDWANQLDELQYVEHEGPCLDCARTGTVFRIRDMADETRWPHYAKRALELGARSSASLPLSSEGQVVGALNIYARKPDVLDAEVVSLAEVIAAHAALSFQVATAFFGHRDLAEQLKRAMASRAVIEQAKGIVMAQRRVTVDQAFDLLKAASQKDNVKLHEIARRVVETGEVT
jgi:GAF domain-containing protein